MSIKRLCLIAGLFGLPVAFANAAELKIRVPVELTNVPASYGREILVLCHAGVGPSFSIAPGAGASGGRASITVPPSRNYRGAVIVKIDAGNDATHYSCRLSGVGTAPPLEGANVVSERLPAAASH